MTKYFTGDLHFCHDAIVQMTNRPFKNATVMNKVLIKNWNSCVTDEDTIYVLGDLTMLGPSNKNMLENIVKKLNGVKILILGNHDNMNPFSYIDMGFQSVHTSLEVEEFILIHDPAPSCIDRSRTWLCAHVHDLFKVSNNVINVGVDMWDYTPVSIEEIREFKNDHMRGV